MALVPIYQYRGDSKGKGTVYQYTPYEQSSDSGWTLDGIAFYGCEQGDPGAVPIYRYFYGVEASSQLWYSTETDQSVDDWHIDVTGPIFYALGPGDPRAQAVLEWINESPHTHYYGGSSDEWLKPPTGDGWTQASGTWFYAVPGSVALQYTVTSLDYGNSASSLQATPVLAATEPIDNTSSLSATQTVTLTTSVTNSYTLTLTDTLTVGAAMEFSAGVPDVDGVKVTVSMSFSMSEQDAWTSSTTEEVTVSTTVNVPPNSHALATMTVSEAQNVSVPCSLSATAKSPGMSSDDLMQVFQDQNPGFSGSVKAKTPTSLAIRLNGTFTGSWRLSASLDIKDKNGGSTNVTPTASPTVQYKIAA